MTYNSRRSYTENRYDLLHKSVVKLVSEINKQNIKKGIILVKNLVALVATESHIIVFIKFDLVPFKSTCNLILLDHGGNETHTVSNTSNVVFLVSPRKFILLFLLTNVLIFFLSSSFFRLYGYFITYV